MTYRHAFITHAALAQIEQEARRNRWCETGGALVGYQTKDAAVVITHASGPGPRARKKFFSVVIDGRYTTTFCDKIYVESGRRFDYIGDWHTHPSSKHVYSKADVRAMQTIADSGSCAVACPLSLIYATRRGTIAAYYFSEGAFSPVGLSVIEGMQ